MTESPNSSTSELREKEKGRSPKNRSVRRWFSGLGALLFLFLGVDSLLTHCAGSFAGQAGEACSARCGASGGSAWAYVFLGVALGCFLVFLWARHEYATFKARRGDPGVVDALIVEARVAIVLDPPAQTSLDDLHREADRLESIGKDEWTEYQVLPLTQMLVDFLRPDDLEQTVNSVLDQIREYAEDSVYRYDREYFGRWEERADKAKKGLDGEAGNPDKQPGDPEPLRAVLRQLYDHVADFQLNWNEGAEIIRALMFAGIVSVPVFVVMALIPVLHHCGNGLLGVLHWSLLGMSGSLTASALALRRSTEVEVGNTVGKQELRRSLLGAVLGFVAGALAYGVAAGGLVFGPAIPNLSIAPMDLDDIALSIVLGTASGFSFERIFERVRGFPETGG